MSDSAPVVSKIVAAPANLLAPELPAALETGFPAVDAEHRQLLACMRTLRGLCDGLYTRNDCSGCSVGQRQLCDNNLVSLLGDLLAFILEHFQTEEAAIRDSLLQIVDRDLCEAHAEDHAEISTKVQEIVCALDPQRTVVLLRELDRLLRRWLENHIQMHDLVVARWMQREAAMFGQGPESAR